MKRIRLFGASRAQIRLWSLLTAAFLVVGCSFGFAMLKLSVDRYTDDYRAELSNLASVVALSIDPTLHEKIKSPQDIGSPAYREIARKLAEVKRSVPELRYVYTLRKEPDGYNFVVDPTPPGDHDADGVDDKSYVDDPYPELSDAGKQAFASGMTTVEPEPYSDRWGTFLSAFAPIHDTHGNVIAVVGLDRLADDLVAHTATMRTYAVGGFLFILAMGAFFAWAFMQKMSRSAENRGWLRYLTGSKRTYQTTLFELALACLALVAFLGAVKNLSGDERTVQSIQSIDKRLVTIRNIQSVLANSIVNQTPSAVAASEIAARAQTADIAWLYSWAAGRDNIDGPEALRDVSRKLDVEVRQLDRRKAQDLDSLGNARRDIYFLFIVAGVLTIASLAFVRAASIQHQDLVAAQTDSEWHQVAYRQVVENLPIGLFMAFDGTLTFSNEAWNAQCGLVGDEDRTERMQCVLSPADRDRFFNTLAQAQATCSSFEFQYSIELDSEIKTFESRGVPLTNADGEVECLLGFTNDVTHRAKVQDLLKGKNREVQSKNRMLSRAISELEENFEAMVQTLVKAVEAKDIYTAGHSERVMQYSLMIGDRLRLPASEMRTLQMGTLIHDIGKIGIPDEILTKPGVLTAEEYAIVRTHAERGAQMVENIPTFQDCVPIVRWHHERLNGSGYPSGLKSADIPLLVRIAAVADVFDALTSSRAYRNAMTPEEACQVLHKMTLDDELDPKLVAILTDIVEKEGVLWPSEASRAA